MTTAAVVDASSAPRGVRSSLWCYLHACPICGGGATSHYCRVPSLFTAGEYITYERCAMCDTVFRNPRLPDHDRLTKYVEKRVDPGQAECDALARAHCFHMARRLRRFLPPGARGRLLDFGCGTGGFLLAARAAGFHVQGLEVSRALASFVTERYGIPVFAGVIADPAFAGSTFDVITSRQVFEHLTDPKGTLLALKDHLERPGLILIEVPNLMHIRERLRRGSMMDDSHLFYFNRSSLANLLESCGFTVLRVSEGLRPYRFVKDGTRLPSLFVESCEQFLSLCQIKTGLSIIASLRE